MELEVSQTEWSPAGNVNRFNKALSNQLWYYSLIQLHSPSLPLSLSFSVCLCISVMVEWWVSREGDCQNNNLHAAVILKAFRYLPVCLFSAVGLGHCSLSVVCLCVCMFEYVLFHPLQIPQSVNAWVCVEWEDGSRRKIDVLLWLLT